MNTKLKQKAKNNSEKDCFKLMNNAILGKIMKNRRKHRNNNRKKKKLLRIRTKL